MEEMMEYEYQAHLKKQQQPQPPQSLPERKKTVAQKKPTSIHDAAQTGDLRTVQIRLQENATLINLRNPIMTETPLHKAAANNHVDVMKFLLEWKGEEKPDLEAKNMYGETALHLAAKNGCAQAVKLLLVGEFVGHTGPRTRIKIKEAEGGILFVDEAYRLMPVQSGTDKDYGIEALEEIMSFMDAGKVVVIFAGYPEPMQRVLGANEGFCRRVNRFFHFDDFSTKEIAQIVHTKLEEQKAGSLIHGFKLAKDCTVDAVAELLERKTTAKQRHLLNGGLVWPLLVNARENLDERLDFDCHNPEELVTITMEDLRAGCHLLPLN